MQQPSFISKRAQALQPSLTLAISARAKALKTEGRDICSLSAGEPDFNTPEFITEAAVKALRDGITRYGPAAGDPELREAIANKIKTINETQINDDQVLITNGGKQAIFNLFQVILNPGDEVIIPSPYWLSYPEIVKLSGAIVRKLESSPENEFRIDIEKLESSINSNTRLLIINSPSNPTGRVITLDEIKSIANILRKHPKLLLMTDEIYEFLLAENEIHYNFCSIAPDLQDRVFTVNGFAKGWAMTGWRIGYLTGNKEVINAAIALQSQSTSNVCSFAQKGALAALQGPRDCVEYMVKKYNKRRRILVDGLCKINGLRTVPPQGAFYAFPKLPENCPDSLTFCKKALDEFGLAMIPGSAFGNDRCIRLSYAASSETIIEGVKRLKAIIESRN